MIVLEKAGSKSKRIAGVQIDDSPQIIIGGWIIRPGLEN